MSSNMKTTLNMIKASNRKTTVNRKRTSYTKPIINMKPQLKKTKPNLQNEVYQTEQDLPNQTFQSNKSKAPKLNSLTKLANSKYVSQSKKIRI